MKIFQYILISIAILLTHNIANSTSPWLKNLNSPEKQEQMQLRWKAYGGEVDLKFMYKKLSDMKISVSPEPQFPNKHWDFNHIVYPISKSSQLELQMPYGNIEKVTSGLLNVDSDFSLTHGKTTIKVNSFKLIPTENPLNQSDIVTFKFIDQNNNHLFTIDSVHIEYDREKELLLMSNMDLFATPELAKLLNYPELSGQVVGQIHTYNQLQVPENAEKELLGSCVDHPVWPPQGQVDVTLIDIGSVQWMRDIGTDKIVVAPSARLKNDGTADVPWYSKFSGTFAPYNNDQHPFLNWAIYREIDGRFEQLGYSGVKHAFWTINSNCTINCGNNHILWLGCEDVYGTGNNDSSGALGPRAEIEADTGYWESTCSFFDPGCIGSQTTGSNATDENRLVVYNDDLTDVNNSQMFIQAWYLIRDDVNIFNTMGYRTISPVDNGNSWSMNAGPTFSQGAALDNYVPPNTSGAMQASSTVETGEGQFTVAVKVIDLGGGSYRYNYAIENYEFDPRFISYHVPLSTTAPLINPVFADPDHDIANDWQFGQSGNMLNITGASNNEQDWGMLFSFSFTTNAAPVPGQITIGAAHTPAIPGNSSVTANILIPETVILPDEIFKNGFDRRIDFED
ncbi:MAG: hypothetical protein KDI59_03955 [Xanthomonadales bacterium]|nr:hypothetical protein [Xanthomonadales bacterium]